MFMSQVNKSPDPRSVYLWACACGTIVAMGVRLAVLAYSNQDRIDLSRRVDDRTACDDVVHGLFPRTPLVPSKAVTLLEVGIPDRGVIAGASFEQGVLIATRDAHLYNPSKLHPRYLKPTAYTTLQLFTQRSFNDMFAYARWSHGKLVRSISINPIGGVWESHGPPELFEVPFWAGTRPFDDYPLPFHPLDLSDAALSSELNLCGELAEGLPGMSRIDEVVLTTYERAVGVTQNARTDQP